MVSTDIFREVDNSNLTVPLTKDLDENVEFGGKDAINPKINSPIPCYIQAKVYEPLICGSLMILGECGHFFLGRRQFIELTRKIAHNVKDWKYTAKPKIDSSIPYTYPR